LNRTDFCEVEIEGMASGLSTGAYYFCSILLFFLLILGINASPLFSAKGKDISRMMASKGVGAFYQIMCEYLAFVCMAIVTLLLICMFLFVVLNAEVVQIPEWRKAGAEPIPVFFVDLLLVVVMISAFQFLIYELVPGVVGSILLQFICSISMGYVSGYFYPTGFFPDILQRIGQILPTGVVLSYAGNCITGEQTMGEIVFVLLYTIVFLGIIVLVRKNRIQRG